MESNLPIEVKKEEVKLPLTLNAHEREVALNLQKHEPKVHLLLEAFPEETIKRIIEVIKITYTTAGAAIPEDYAIDVVAKQIARHCEEFKRINFFDLKKCCEMGAKGMLGGNPFYNRFSVAKFIEWEKGYQTFVKSVTKQKLKKEEKQEQTEFEKMSDLDILKQLYKFLSKLEEGEPYKSLAYFSSKWFLLLVEHNLVPYPKEERRKIYNRYIEEVRESSKKGIYAHLMDERAVRITAARHTQWYYLEKMIKDKVLTKEDVLALINKIDTEDI